MHDGGRGLVLDEAGACRAVDFLRGWSIFTIVLMHLVQIFLTQLPDIFSTAASVGGTGAHVFFFCSGFGLYLSHLRRPVTARRFFARRLEKTYFPYLLVVFLSAFVPELAVGCDRLGAVLAPCFPLQNVHSSLYGKLRRAVLVCVDNFSVLPSFSPALPFARALGQPAMVFADRRRCQYGVVDFSGCHRALCRAGLEQLLWSVPLGVCSGHGGGGVSA